MRGIRIKNWNFIIGLTGGIGSGKSTVLALFKKKGAFVLDCDRIVHHLLDKDKKVKKELIGQFGPELFDHGLLNKKALAKLVFQSPVKRKLLENIIHPRVRKSVIQSLKSKKGTIAVVDVPLLYESGWKDFFDWVLVVNASQKNRLKRLFRKGMKLQDAKKRMKAQMPLEKKVQLADFVINNNTTQNHTRDQVHAVWTILTQKP